MTKLFALSMDEWKVLIASMVLLPLSGLLLRMKGFSGARTVLLHAMPYGTGANTDEQFGKAQQVSRMVHIAASKGLFHTSCLARSLVLARLLQRRGIDCAVRIGAESGSGKIPGDKGFAAHAWVELDGEVVNDHENVKEQFTPFDFQFKN